MTVALIALLLDLRLLYGIPTAAFSVMVREPGGRWGCFTMSCAANEPCTYPLSTAKEYLFAVGGDVRAPVF